MSALVVVESYFGNTHHVAEVVAGTIRSHGVPTDVANVEDAPIRLSDEIELLIVGAPTHDLGMSTAESRQAACARTGRAGSRRRCPGMAGAPVDVGRSTIGRRVRHPHRLSVACRFCGRPGVSALV